MGSWCLQATRSYKGPLIAIGIGVGFMIVGAVPVAITFGIHAKGSATIIGMGFIGFGLLVVLPGVCWCVVRRITAFRCCQSKQERLHLDDECSPEDDTTILEKTAHKLSSPGKVCYMMASDRCHVDSGDGRVGDIEELEEDCQHQHDDGDVRLTR